MKTESASVEELSFNLVVLGRTLEHFGAQMYKRREVAIAELVANAWDAGANNVFVEVPSAPQYDPANSQISITDDGSGMSPKDIQSAYLVVGRNRRRDGEEGEEGASENPGASVPAKRPVMGRKGIGKLAGFGIARKMVVTTWTSESCIQFMLDIEALKKDDGEAGAVPVPAQYGSSPVETTSGTQVVLQGQPRIAHLARAGAGG